MCLIINKNENVLTSLIWIVMKGLYSFNSYWVMMQMVIQGIDPMTYNKLWWLIKKLKIFERGTYLRTEWTRQWEVLTLHRGRFTLWFHMRCWIPYEGYSSYRFPWYEAPIAKWHVEILYLYLSSWTMLPP